MGSVQQEEFARVVEYFTTLPGVNKDDIGIVSFSIGIIIALGALAKFPLPVNYLFDWEGPSNKFNITMNDTFEPLDGYPNLAGVILEGARGGTVHR